MGLIQAAAGAIGGTLADQWVDAIAAQDMGEGIVFTKGVQMRQGGRGSNKRGSEDIITDGSKLLVYDRQALLNQ